MDRLQIRLMPLGLGMMCLGLVMLLMAGCRGGKDKGGLDPMGGVSPPSTGPVAGGNGEELPTIDVDVVRFDPARDLHTVYFAFDSASLDASARDVLQASAERLKASPGELIQIAGHCDERGTQEYNLALGEQRAQSVRNYLRQLGVSGDRMVTITYGEEMPAELGSNEVAWAKNRRCEFARNGS